MEVNTMAKSTRSGNGKTTRKSGAVGKSAPKVVTEEQIRVRAYEIYLAEGGSAGDALGHWLRAEQELCTGGRRK
jgi:hypothetical protein